MRLRVNECYRGRLTGEIPIAPGTYDHDSRFLFGLADLLVSKGLAVWAEEKQVEPSQEAIEPVDKPVSHDEALARFETTKKETQKHKKRGR